MDIFNCLVHVIIAVIVAIPVSHIPGDILFAVLAALLPDIDHKRSVLGRYNPFAHLGWTKHRGFTHTLSALIIFSIPFIVMGNLTFVVGYLSHLLTDYIHSWGRWKIRWF